MRTIVSLTLLLIILCFNSGYAQEYKAGVLYNVKGPVKQIKMKSKDKLSQKFGSTKFTETGKFKRDILTYDDKGYPLKSEMQTGPLSMSVSIEYAENQHPSEIKINSSFSDKPVTIVYEYDGDRVAVRKFIRDDVTITFIYSDEQYDNYGNWISRNVVKSKESSDTDKNSESSYVETREIKYYE
ncbi:MAG: hypothetical protein NC201_02390 [Prevotella sp.]|nr:hypothetical protein [Bacteroides sp.]MCM1366075.1 hypothetical protein [Prevotella sp.]MCM1436560.1 hypothetical protein [Prevotella sp.]